MEKMNKSIEEAYSLFQGKKYDEALAKLDETEVMYVESETEDPEFFASLENFRGFNYLAKNELGKAREHFESALSTNPKSSQACTGLGELFYLLSMEYEAKVMYEWALEYNPANKLAEAGLGKVNMSLGFSKTHKTLEPENEDKKGFYGSVAEAYKYFNEGDFAKTIEVLDSLDEDENLPETSTLLNFKGFTYLFLERFEEARTSFEKSLELNGESSQACAGLAELFYINGEYESAETMFEWAVKHNPANKFATAGLEKTKNIEMTASA